MQAYEKIPDAIYAKSFAIIRQEADFSRFSKAEAHVAERVIHSCGMTDAADDLMFSEGAAEAGRAALLNGAPVICDAEMVRHGVIARLLPKQNEVICLLSDPRVPDLAQEEKDDAFGGAGSALAGADGWGGDCHRQCANRLVQAVGTAGQWRAEACA